MDGYIKLESCNRSNHPGVSVSPGEPGLQIEAGRFWAFRHLTITQGLHGDFIQESLHGQMFSAYWLLERSGIIVHLLTMLQPVLHVLMGQDSLRQVETVKQGVL